MSIATKFGVDAFQLCCGHLIMWVYAYVGLKGFNTSGLGILSTQ